jgi:hypothetical protein
MKLEVKDNCPLNNFEPCKKFDCAWFIELRGVNPQTGIEEPSTWGCAVAMMPLIGIEQAQQTRQAGAAIESFRNEVVKDNNEIIQLFSDNPQDDVKLVNSGGIANSLQLGKK